VEARLTTDELAAWRGFLQTHARLTRRLDEELRAAHDLPLTSYDVLVQLEGAPGRQMRMSELADAVLLSRSGLTRLVDRLERQGLIERRECPDDARGSLAALTGAGAARLAEARPTHIAGVRRLFLEPLDHAERRQMAAVWEQLLEAGGA
jgi:DNA-binding MarR family transcriptional regulator